MQQNVENWITKEVKEDYRFKARQVDFSSCRFWENTEDLATVRQENLQVIRKELWMVANFLVGGDLSFLQSSIICFNIFLKQKWNLQIKVRHVNENILVYTCWEDTQYLQDSRILQNSDLEEIQNEASGKSLRSNFWRQKSKSRTGTEVS